jgi:hypothetical protein
MYMFDSCEGKHKHGVWEIECRGFWVFLEVRLTYLNAGVGFWVCIIV